MDIGGLVSRVDTERLSDKICYMWATMFTGFFSLQKELSVSLFGIHHVCVCVCTCLCMNVCMYCMVLLRIEPANKPTPPSFMPWLHHGVRTPLL